MIDEDLLYRIYPVVRLYVNGYQEKEIVEEVLEFDAKDVEDIIKFFNRYRIEVMDFVMRKQDLWENFHIQRNVKI